MYRQFAHFYDSLGWNRYAQELWKELKKFLQVINYHPKTMLDIACGTGVLTIEARKYGIQATGLDISKEMLEKAKSNALREMVEVNFILKDMRSFELNEKYDLITCTFDAINHLPEFNEWEDTFRCVKKHLNDTGLFIFDMNTLKDLRENWNNIRIKKYPQGNYLLTKSISYENTAYITFTAFIKREDGLYENYEETIKEVSFPIVDVVNALYNLGFNDVRTMNMDFEITDNPEDLFRVIICACNKPSF